MVAQPGPWDFTLTHLLMIAAPVVAAWGWLAKSYIDRLGDKDACEAIRDDYRGRVAMGRWTWFRDGLAGMLARMDRFFGYGEGAFLGPWGRCLALAFVYPILFFLIGYAASGRGDVAGFEMLDPGLGDGRRIALLGWLLAVALFFYRAVRRKWFERAGRWAARRVGGRAGETGAKGWVAAIAENVAFAFAFAFAFAGAAAAAGAGAVAGAGAGAGAWIFIFGADNALSIVFSAFFVLFPLFNSVLDWASLTVTRALIGGWVAGAGGMAGTAWRYLGGLGADLVAALGFLTLLSGALSAGVFGLNAVLAGAGASIQLDWPAQMRSFRDDPLGDGLMMTLMLGSTMLPTVAHLIAGTAALLFMPHQGRAPVLDAVEEACPLPFNRAASFGVVMALQWVIPAAFWLAAFGLALRWFAPMSWFGAGDGHLLTWLPYQAAEAVWFWLSAP